MLPTIRLQFHPLETVFPANNGYITNCTIHQGPLTYNNVVYDSIEYAFNYEESLSEACFFCCTKSECCGYHLGDRERVMLLLKNNVIQYVYFNAHSPGEGTWLSWAQCDKDIDNNLIVYVSRGNHAFYPRPETYLRIFGFSNDTCSDEGLSITTNIVGTHNDYLIPKQHSITPTQRFFLPFVVLCLRNAP